MAVRDDGPLTDASTDTCGLSYIDTNGPERDGEQGATSGFRNGEPTSLILDARSWVMMRDVTGEGRKMQDVG